jgi:hypothetical protein
MVSLGQGPMPANIMKPIAIRPVTIMLDPKP